MVLLLKNHSTCEIVEDKLFRKAVLCPFQSQKCNSRVCTGSTVLPVDEMKPNRSKDEIKLEAKQFLEEYVAFTKLNDYFGPRWDEVTASIDSKGYYDLTTEELVFGVKTAWRNAPRCIGRIQWNKIQIFDCREVTTATQMFEAICRHLQYATNGGNLRSAITIFRPRLPGHKDFRVWNQQLIQFAGYQMNDDSVLGDPANIEFTQVCERLGWWSEPGHFNHLPLILSADGGPPELFEIPDELVLKVKLTHPTYNWFAALNLEWFAVPAVSGMSFDCGGIEFPACPFNGWYMETEIGCRNLADVHRYNLLPKIAAKLDLDIGSYRLWKDKALVELNIAVLHSFKKASVTIVDHHTASEQFMRHYENEKRSRGGCPADWVWIVPPLSSSATPVYHQEFAVYQLKPSFDYQEKAWLNYVWTGEEVTTKRVVEKLSIEVSKAVIEDNNLRKLKIVATAVLFAMKLLRKILAKRKKVCILYATETGKSEGFARKLGANLSRFCNVKVSCMDDYPIEDISSENWLLIVSSTFNSGEPPENGRKFSNQLQSIKQTGKTLKDNNKLLHLDHSQSFMRCNSTIKRKLSSDNNNVAHNLAGISLRDVCFAVFGLGSSAYPNFCGFGHYVNNLLEDLGGNRLMDLQTGDELHGQDQAFIKWEEEIYRLAKTGISPSLRSYDWSSETSSLEGLDFEESAELVPAEHSDDFVTAISTLHPSSTRLIQGYKIINRKPLDGHPGEIASTIHVTLQTFNHSPLEYQVGDHVGIFPCNSTDLVKGVLSRLSGLPLRPNAPVYLKNTTAGQQNAILFPRCTVKELLTRYLDITQPPHINLLGYLAEISTDPVETAKLENLVENGEAYQQWKETHWPDILNVLQQFPNTKPDAAKLCSLLPKMQPRFYSVSSTPLFRYDELQLTVGLVEFETMDGAKRFGVCSSYLNDVPLGTILPCFVRPAPSFHLPENNSKPPLILVGPGTGIAPFKGFISEIEMLKNKVQFGEVFLYHGCRFTTSVLYKKDFQEFKKNAGGRFKFRVGFSREVGIKKTYVQDLIYSDSKILLQKIMEENAQVYVCGDANMAEDVYNCFKKVLKENCKMDDAKAENVMLRLRDENRYHEDIFGALYKINEFKMKVKNEEIRGSKLSLKWKQKKKMKRFIF